MPKTKPFRLLKEKFTAEDRECIAELKKQFEDEMKLEEVREQLDLSQERLAALLKTSQPNVSRLERQTDMLISTLRSYVRAMGGDLEICIRFPEATVRLKGLGELHRQPVQ